LDAERRTGRISLWCEIPLQSEAPLPRSPGSVSKSSGRGALSSKKQQRRGRQEGRLTLRKSGEEFGRQVNGSIAPRRVEEKEAVGSRRK
jgi:hypothetical protein